MKKMVAVILVFAILAGGSTQIFALTINAESAIVLDASTGEVLFEQNSDQMMVPASMTKWMRSEETEVLFRVRQ